jgi:CRISPR type III-A-associated protein Csm2
MTNVRQQNRNEIPNPSNLIRDRGFLDQEVLNLIETFAAHTLQGEGGRNTINQLRKVYNQIRIMKQQADAEDDPSQFVQLQSRLLKAQVSYAKARTLTTTNFKDFFDVCMDRLRANPNELDDLVTMFEIFYAYAYSAGGRT